MSKRGKSDLILVLGVLVCVVIVLFFSWKFAEIVVPSTSQPNPPDTNIFAQDLATNGWIFIPVDPKDPRSAGITQIFLTKDGAIAAANNNYPYLQKSPDLKNIVAYLGLFSDPGLQEAAQQGEKVDPTFLKPRLVWIISFKGIKEQSSGPPGSEHRISNELDVVIDAVTGERLMDFVWTR
jgi:hypothetical protein